MNITKGGLTLNDLYDTTCMAHNRFSNFQCVYTITEVAHIEFIKVALTEYSAFEDLSKMSQEHVAAAVIIALISEKKQKGKEKKRIIWMESWLKRRKKLRIL